MSPGYETDTAEGWIDNPADVGIEVVKQWLAEHDASLDEFIADNGTCESYGSDKVFAWLGY